MIINYSKLSKKELLEMVKLNDSIINNVPIGFCITDEDGFLNILIKHIVIFMGIKKMN